MCSVFFLIEKSQASQDTFGLMVFNRNRTFGLYCFPECEKKYNLRLVLKLHFCPSFFLAQMECFGGDSLK